MNNDWLQFLFGESQVQQEIEDQGVDMVRLFEKADAVEMEQMKFNKSSLADALKACDITPSGGLQLDADGFTLTCDDQETYAAILNKLSDVDNMHRLAEAGWVAEKCGDQAMSNEPAEFKIRFLEITEVEASTAEHVHSEDTTNPDLEGVIKKAREFATTPLDRDDDLNPVENAKEAKQGEKQKGVGNAKDGASPEGKPKGVTSKTESYQPRTGQRCTCSPGVQRDNCSKCEGTGWEIDFSKIRKANRVANDDTDSEDKSSTSESKQIVTGLLGEGAHKPGCTCGFCKNKGSFGRKKDKPKSEDDEGGLDSGDSTESGTDFKPSEGQTAQSVADRLLEQEPQHENFTGTGSMGALEMGQPGDGLETKGRGGHKLGRKFKMPPQWKQKTPITRKHEQQESAENDPVSDAIATLTEAGLLAERTSTETDETLKVTNPATGNWLIVNFDEPDLLAEELTALTSDFEGYWQNVIGQNIE